MPISSTPSVEAIPKTKFISKVSQELICFADSLKPSEDDIAKGKKKVQNVFEAMKKEDHFSIARNFIGGSVGKNTSVLNPDFDCTLFLNNQLKPPLTDCVEQFEKYLRDNATKLEIVPESISTSSITVSAKFKDGTELDLLPACNFAPNPEDQRKEVLKRIGDNPIPKVFVGLSSSLAETQLNFIKSQNGPTHQLIRLCKYWYKSLSLDEYIYGGSSIIEIICVASTVEIEKDDNMQWTMLQALKTFFEKICKADKLKIAFVKENGANGGWKMLSEGEMKTEKYKKHFNFKSDGKGKTGNYIFEPANPFNNLGKNLRKGVGKLKQFAAEMLKRVADLEKPESSEMKTVNPDKSITVHFEKVFQPFPIRLRDQYPHSAIPLHLFIQYDYKGHKSSDCAVRGKHEAGKSVTHTIKKNILFLLRAQAMRDEKNYLQFNNGVPVFKKQKDARSAIGVLIKENFGLTKLVKEDGTTQSEHDSCNVSMCIPYMVVNSHFAIKFSMKWSS